MARPYIAWPLVLLLCGGTLAVLWPSPPGSFAEKQAIAEGRVVITYWDKHTGHEHDARLDLITEFNQSQHEVYVRALPIGAALMEKLATAIAGACPPDVCGLDGNMLAQLAAQGFVMPLDDFMKSDQALRQDALFPHMWKSVCLRGHVYGIPTVTDSYCLLWNKDDFRRAGLDPDSPPQTIEELEQYAARLTIQESSAIQQIGFLPWWPWDNSYMWGALFGGNWFDDDQERMVCAGDRRLARSLAWQQSFAADPNATTQPPYAIAPERLMNFVKSYGSAATANNPFYSGKLAMVVNGEWECAYIPRFAPELNWAAAPIPAPAGAEPVAFGDTCVADCVPAGCRHPEAALRFLKWFHTPRPGGGLSPVSDYAYAIHNIPVRPAEAQQPRFADDARFKVFVDVLLSRRIVTAPVLSEAQFMFDEIDRIRERVVMRLATPEQALRSLETSVNQQIERTAAFMRRSAL